MAEGDEPRRRGRPPDERKTAIVSFRISVASYDRLIKLAHSQKRDISDVLRERLRVNDKSESGSSGVI